MSSRRGQMQAALSTVSEDDVVRLGPQDYIHVSDSNTNVTIVKEGPLTYTRQDNEQIVLRPQKKVVVPPNHYCVIINPVVRDDDGRVVTDRHGQAKVRLGDREVRLNQEPFALYPGEILEFPEPRPLKVLKPFTGLRLRALVNFEDTEACVSRVAGEEWVFPGPGTYTPRVEVEEMGEIEAEVIKVGESLKLRARQALRDASGAPRRAGDEWLVAGPRAYLPGVDEVVVERVVSITLTDELALHIEALVNFTDAAGVKRKAGEQILVTKADTPDATFTPSPHERVVKRVGLTTLNARQYAVVTDPYIDGKQRLGLREVRKGPTTFFLQPGEALEGGSIKDVYLLGQKDALLLTTSEAFQDGDVERKPGDRWLILGPRDYIPPAFVTVVEQRYQICLDETEGVYVRNIYTGVVRTVVGTTHMLQPDEELWAKSVPPKVEELLTAAISAPVQSSTSRGATPAPKLDRTRMLSYNVPHNCILQVYDFKRKVARIVFGPEQVRLDPDEQFTLVSLSGGRPKESNRIHTLHVFLGPDFMTDIINVETADHARLSLQLSYTWYFDVKPGDVEAGARVFSVPDFVGDACRAVSSRVRGAVANEPFDAFHKNSSRIIKVAVFGLNPDGTPRDRLVFKNNLLVITNVDIQSVEPVDQKTRDSLIKSVQLAIEITTRAQEATARHEASEREQKAKGELERQIIDDKAETETKRMKLLELQGENAAIEAAGTSMAEAKAKAAADLISGNTEVVESELRVGTELASVGTELELAQKVHDADVEHQAALDALEVLRAEELAKIDSEKFRKQVGAVGRDTIKAIARAGPELQAKLLSALNLQGFMMTDGTTPVNLFGAAAQMTGMAGGGAGVSAHIEGL